jgi:tRNA-Thr(GGU) m(6)t(6)A37 methyltransferase TsaA
LPEEIILKPVGIVKSGYTDTNRAPEARAKAIIKVYPEYEKALLRISEHSHIWILSWFHLRERGALTTTPGRLNHNLPEFGVFGLRAPVRPNPIGLSLVKLDRVEGRLLHVTGLDAVDGTPVVDIKPYFENDIIFSPRTPHIYPLKREMRRGILLQQALAHHQEECVELLMAVRMALVATERLGQLNSPGLFVSVEGSACLADTIQGLARARLANPHRFQYRLSGSLGRTTWRRGKKLLIIIALKRLEKGDFLSMPDGELLEVIEREDESNA